MATNYLSLRSTILNNFSAYNINDSTITAGSISYSSIKGSTFTATSGAITTITYSTLTGSSIIASTISITSSIVSFGQSTNTVNFGQSQGSYVPTAWYSTLNATFTPTTVTKVSMVANAQHQLAVNGQSTVSSILLTANAGQLWTSLSAVTGLPSATTTNYSSGAICSLGIYSLLAANGGYLYLSNNTAASYANVNPNTPTIHLPFENSVTNIGSGSTTLTVTGSPGYIPGIVGSYAIKLSNTAGGNASQFIQGTWSPNGSISVSVWFNMQSNSTGNHFVFSGYGGNFLIYITGSQTGSILSFFVNGINLVQDPSSIVLNKWYNVTVIYQPSSTGYLYVNNILVGTYASCPSTPGTSTGRFTIGGNDTAGASSSFNGYIDDVKVYNYAITVTPMVPANWSNVAISGNAQYMLATAANGGLFMSSNFGSTWQQISSVALQAYWTGLSLSHSGQYMLSSGGVAVTPQLTGLASNTWTVNGVTWTASASSVLSSVSHPAYSTFNNYYGGNYPYSWASAANYNSSGVYNNTYSTTVLGGIGTVYGEWLQIQSSVPLIIYSYTFACGGFPHLPKTYYIVGSNDGINWYPIQSAAFAANPFNSNFSVATTYIVFNLTSAQSMTAATTQIINTTAYSYSTNAYTYFRIISTTTFGTGTVVELGEWYINFLGGHSYSTNYGQTWNNTLQQSTFAAPQLTSLASNTWTVNGVTWTASATSFLGGSWPAYGAFNNYYGSNYPYSWASDVNYNTSGVYQGTKSTTVLGVGAVTGEWLQLQSSIPLVMYSYSFAVGGFPNLPKTYYIVGSNDGINWYPIQSAAFAANPFNANFSVATTYIVLNSTSAQTMTAATTQTVNTTAYSYSTNAYTYFRIIGTTTFSTGTIVELGEWYINFINAGSNGLITSTFAAPSAIAVSGNGQYAIGAYNQTPYVISNYLAGLSTNTYTTPTLTSINATIIGAALSYTGQQQVLVTAGTTNNLYYSINYGSTFTGISLGSAALVSVAMSYDGSYITAASATTVYTLNSNGTAYTVAVGTNAGQQNQSQNSIAIGTNAGQINQTANSIVLSGQNTAVNATNAGFFVAPIANAYQSTASSFNLLGYSSQDNQVVQSGITTTNQQQTIYGEWIQVQLTNAVSITSYVLQGRITALTRYLSAWTLIGSSDGLNWTLLDQQTGGLQTLWGTSYTIKTPAPSYSYYRIIFNGVPLGYADLGGFFLYTGNNNPVFGSYTNYTVIQSGLYNILQYNGSTVCIITYSWPTTNTTTAMGIIGDGTYILPTFQAGWIVTQNWYLLSGNNFLGFQIISNGPAYEYNSSFIAVQGTSTTVNITSVSIAGPTTITGPLTATTDAVAQGIFLTPSAANSSTILSYFQKIVNTVTPTAGVSPFWASGYSYGATLAHGQSYISGITDGAYFSGGILLPNGNVCLVPTNSSTIAIYNPNTNTCISGGAHGISNFYIYFSGVLLPNSKVVFIPLNAPNFGIYNYLAPTATAFTLGVAHNLGANPFAGGILLPNGNIVCVPYMTTNIGIYNPNSNTFTVGPSHGIGQGNNAFIGGVLLPNGNVILVPASSANIGIYNYITNTYIQGPVHGQAGSAFYGGVLLPNGNVVFIPQGSANIGIYNPTSNTYTSGPAATGFYGGVLLPNGNVLLVPNSSAYYGIYNPTTNTFSSGVASTAFRGGILLPNGNVVCVPDNSSTIGILSTQLSMPRDACLSPYLNKF